MKILKKIHATKVKAHSEQNFIHISTKFLINVLTE